MKKISMLIMALSVVMVSEGYSAQIDRDSYDMERAACMNKRRDLKNKFLDKSNGMSGRIAGSVDKQKRLRTALVGMGAINGYLNSENYGSIREKLGPEVQNLPKSIDSVEEIRDTTKAVKNIFEQYERSIKEYSYLLRQFHALQQKINEIQKEKDELVSAKENAILELQNLLGKKDEQSQELLAEKDVILRDRDVKLVAIRGLENDIRNIRTTITRQNADIEVLKGELDSKEKTLKALQSRIEDLEYIVNSQEEDLAECMSMMENQNSLLDKINEEMEKSDRLDAEAIEVATRLALNNRAN